jgi:hypothetical protein
VKALRRVRGADTDLYARVLDPLDVGVWISKLASTKNGTAPDLSGETIGMLASPDGNCSTLLIHVINPIMRGRRVFTEWLWRAICPIPKVPGNPDVALSRSLTLRYVSEKVFWGVITDRITSVRRESSLLQKQQYGFQRGIRTDEPLMIAIMLSQDTPVAFDSASRIFETMVDLGYITSYASSLLPWKRETKRSFLRRTVRHRRFLATPNEHPSPFGGTHKDALHQRLSVGLASTTSSYRCRMT